MKSIFYTGLAGIVLFEFFRVYFIMPLPGSQEINSLDLAYYLHSRRWLIRAFFGLMILAGSFYVFKGKRKWIPLISLIIPLLLIYEFNFPMNADHMFLQVKHLRLNTRSENKLPESAIIIGVANNNEAKAYPVRFLTYHHQVRDKIGGKDLMITYCSVCRTGRVYEPVVNNKTEVFRLVGMDNFNAMFEDETTKSWWRQSTGEAVTGKLKGYKLTEFESKQMTLKKWFELYPESLVMQSDAESLMEYDSLARFEIGKSKGDLTRTDSLSWKNKSWVIGIEINKKAKAFDWLDLKKLRVINDAVGNTPILIALASDNQSFTAFERPDSKEYKISNDSLISDSNRYDFYGRNVKKSKPSLKSIPAYQEFWHSWKTFHNNSSQWSVNSSQ